MCEAHTSCWQIKSNNHIKSQSQINISKDDDEGNFFFKSKTLQELKDEGTRCGVALLS